MQGHASQGIVDVYGQPTKHGAARGAQICMQDRQASAGTASASGSAETPALARLSPLPGNAADKFIVDFHHTCSVICCKAEDGCCTDTGDHSCGM